MSKTIHQLPEAGFLRMEQIIRQPKKLDSSSPALVPVCRSVWIAKVNSGEFPQPVKIGRSNLWRVEDIRKLIEKLGASQ